MASVENRVVSIGFNNKAFGSKVGETLSTLDKLKAKLEFKSAGKDTAKGLSPSLSVLDKLKNKLRLKGGTKGLEDVASASTKFKLTGVDKATEGISKKFIAMSAIAITALSNITTKALGMATDLAKTFTVTPISEGFTEYELKMGAIQTIMAGSGESLQVVNGYLEELNKYSDDTIYSFADMTQNIGKFTNAGVGLGDSVNAIKGVANVAALSGSNAQQASAAMYNFAQALSSGSVKLIDWKSIENAGLATKGFKTEILDTAVAVGTITKNLDGTYQTIAGSPISATKGFNEALQQQFLTTDVLVGTLNRYADETTEIGAAATAAASDVKTFSQLMDTLKEAAASGWAYSFELAIGDFNEAKKLFTELSDAFGGAIGASAEARNAILMDWKKLGGRTVLLTGLRNVMQTISKVLGTVKEAFREVFPRKTGQDLLNLSLGFRAFSRILRTFVDNNLGNIKNIFLGIFSVFGIGVEIVKGVFSVFKALFSIFAGPSSGAILSTAGAFGAFLNKIREFLVDGGVISGIFGAITGAIEKVGVAFRSILGALAPAKEAIFGIFDGLDFSGVSGALGNLKDTFLGLFGSIDFGNVTAPFSKFSKTVIEFVQKINLQKAINAFENFIKKVETFVKKIDLRPALDSINNFALKVKAFIKGINFDPITEAITRFFNKVKTFVKGIDFGPAIEKVKDFFREVKAFFAGIDFQPALDKFTAVTDKIKSFFADIDFSAPKQALLDFKDGFLAMFGQGGGDGDPTQKGKDIQQVVGDVGESADKAGEAFDKFKGVLRSIADAFGLLGTGIKTVMKPITDAFASVAGDAEDAFSFKKLGAIVGGGALVGIAGTIIALINQIKNVFKGGADIMDGIADNLDSVSGAIDSFSLSIKADALFTASKAIGVLALSLILLSFADTGKAALDMGVLAGGLAALVLAMQGLEKIANGPASAIKIAALSGVIIALAVAVGILAVAARLMEGTNWEEMAGGLGSVVGLLLAMGGAIRLMGDPGQMASAGLGILLISAGMIPLAFAIEKLGNIHWPELLQGMGAFAGLLTGLVVAVNLIPWKTTAKTGAAILLISVGMMFMAKAVENMGALKGGDIAKGVAGLAGTLIALGIAMRIAGDKKSIAGAVSIGLSVFALNKLAEVIERFGTIDTDVLKKGMIAVGLGLVGLAVGLYLMSGTILAAAALMLAAQAITVLAGAVEKLGSLPIQVLLIGFAGLSVLMLSMAAATLVFAAAAFVLAPIVPLMLAFGGAIFLLGAGAALFGAGALLFAIALTKVVAAGKEGMAVLVQVIDVIIQKLPALAVALGSALGMFIFAILSQTPQFVQLIASIITQVMDVIVENIPKVISVIGTLLDALLDFLVNRLPDFILVGIQIIFNLLTGLAENIKEFTLLGLEILLQFIEAIKSKVPELVVAAVDLMIEFIGALESKIPDLVTATISLMVTFIDEVRKKFGDVVNAGIDLLIELINGIKERIGDIGQAGIDLVKAFLEKVGGMVLAILLAGRKVLEQLIEGIFENASDLVETGKDAILEFIKGVTSSTVELVDSGFKLMIAFINGLARAIDTNQEPLREAILNLALALIDGLTLGLADNAYKAYNKADEIARTLLSKLAKPWEIFSPSKATGRMGKNLMLGVAVGMDKNKSTATKSAERAGVDILGGLNKGLAKKEVLDTDRLIGNIADQMRVGGQGNRKVLAVSGLLDTDFRPVIRPTVDLTDVALGAKKTSDLFSAGTSTRLDTDRLIDSARIISDSTNAQREQGFADAEAPTSSQITFEQTINAPRCLSTNDIYRATRGQITLAKNELQLMSGIGL